MKDPEILILQLIEEVNDNNKIIKNKLENLEKYPLIVHKLLMQLRRMHF
jgi:hypothetical protein